MTSRRSWPCLQRETPAAAAAAATAVALALAAAAAVVAATAEGVEVEVEVEGEAARIGEDSSTLLQHLFSRSEGRSEG
jgi:hypothetical protein